MKIDVVGKGSFASALIHLEPGEEFVSEAGAMYRASSNVQIDVTTRSRGKGGVLGGIKRMFAGEKFFLSTYHVEDGRTGEVGIAPIHQGEIRLVELDGSADWLCAGGSYLGSTSGLALDTDFQGLKGFFTGESLFFVSVSGKGTMLVGGFGRIIELDVHDDLTVDTGHVIAFEDTLDYELSKAGKSWIQSWLAGEGIVLKFRGRGKILVQSHNPSEFGHAIGSLLPER